MRAHKSALLILICHFVAAGFAWAATGALHIYSGSALWGLFLDAYHVRQFNIFISDITPFYLLAAIFLFTTSQRYRPQILNSILGVAVVGFVASAIATLLHVGFFPTSARGLVLIVAFGQFYVCAFSMACAISAFLLRIEDISMRRICGPVIWLCVIVGFYWVAVTSHLTAHDELYDAALRPSPTTTHEDFGGLFKLEHTGIIAGDLPARFTDLDGDGDIDVVIHGADKKIESWRNDDGVLRHADLLPKELNQISVGVFSFADFNADGRMDLFVADRTSSRGREFENGVLKKSLFYPFRDPAEVGFLFAQTGSGKWNNITAASFPDGLPTMYRKTEPLIVFDADGNGRLDIVWSGYPTPTQHENKLYLQSRAGEFRDGFSDYIEHPNWRVYPEGGDVADIDGDGDIDLFAYGYPVENRDGKYMVRCGAEFPLFECDMPARNDEGLLVEDINGDGAFDALVSYHGAGGKTPKFRLQFLFGSIAEPWNFVRDAVLSQQFYGYHLYLRAKDADFDGKPEILTQEPGRILAYRENKIVDLLPSLIKDLKGAATPMGWLDIDEDGDWDFLVHQHPDDKVFLARNTTNPVRYMKISVVGKGGVENQYGATLRITREDGRKQVFSYRTTAGYRGSADPRIVLDMQREQSMQMQVCFASLSGMPKDTVLSGVTVSVVATNGKCATYEIDVPNNFTRIDLKFVADESTVQVSMH